VKPCKPQRCQELVVGGRRRKWFVALQREGALYPRVHATTRRPVMAAIARATASMSALLKLRVTGALAGALGLGNAREAAAPQPSCSVPGAPQRLWREASRPAALRGVIRGLRCTPEKPDENVA